MYIAPAQPEIMEGCQNRGAKNWNAKQHLLPYAFVTELWDREGLHKGSPMIKEVID